MTTHPETGEPEHVRPVPEVEPLPSISVRERAARGLAARDRAPLARHGHWRPSAGRLDPIALLEQQAARREPSLVPIRHRRMAASAFAFFRGSAAVMAHDLADSAVTGLRAQLCGDAHLVNFGIFDTPERSHVFDINDFDETLPGPWEWDVKRLAASVEVAARDLGLADHERRRAVTATIRAYREQMAVFAGMGNLEVHYAHLDAVDVVARFDALGGHKRDRRIVAHDVAKGLSRGHLTAFNKLVTGTGSDIRFRSDPPLLVPAIELLDDAGRRRYVAVVREFLAQYRDSLSDERRHLLDGYRFVEMARKVVGVGSVGTRAWVVLMTGRDEHDPLMLQLKEAKRSVLEPYAGRSRYTYKGQRVVQGQRSMQSASDPLLGWYRLRALDGRMHDFYVRQLWDGKASIDVGHLDADGLVVYAATCGWTLARAHARTGPRISIATYLGEDDEFDQAIADFASTYADLTEDDHARLVAAIATGRLPATDELI
jgi:uncharacterized protein (DUF2252 family)